MEAGDRAAQVAGAAGAAGAPAGAAVTAPGAGRMQPGLTAAGPAAVLMGSCLGRGVQLRMVLPQLLRTHTKLTNQASSRSMNRQMVQAGEGVRAMLAGIGQAEWQREVAVLHTA
jgi:hypothetical protein